MDFERNDHLSGPTPSQPADSNSGFDMSGLQSAPPRKRTGWRIFWGIVLALSVIANVFLFLMLIGIVAIFATGQKGILAEEIVREGPSRNKIAVITVDGVIHSELANDFCRQLKTARKDRYVKGIIVRVNSSGGTISASDQIHKEISKFREEEQIPVVAFMQGMAASGGYYTSVACEKIIAEPTTITGSIGVISWYLVVQELLENKLGVLPVTIKSGEKKDWPSSFREPSEQEIQYIQDKLITPALKRFIEIVADGRKESLTLDDVKRLADGSIFGAEEALAEKLIDDVGYLDEAVELVKSLARIQDARVVQYRKTFSLSDFMDYRRTNLLKLNRTTLYELSTPQVLYLWSGY